MEEEEEEEEAEAGLAYLGVCYRKSFEHFQFCVSFLVVALQ
jgi:hypothetical protein